MGAEIRVIKRDQLAGSVASGGMVRLAAISEELVGSRSIFLGVSRVPPGLRSSAYVHTNWESALHVALGRGRFLWGSASSSDPLPQAELRTPASRSS